MALERADRANKDALNLLREAQSPLPSIDVNQLEEEAEQIKEDVRRIVMISVFIYACLYTHS